MERYNHIAEMYKTKASLALQFEDNLIVWSIVGIILPFFINFNNILAGVKHPTLPLIFAIFALITLPIVLIIFSFLKYKEYNHMWRECIIKALLIDFYSTKNKSKKSHTFDEIARYIENITGFKYNEIMAILIRFQKLN